LLRATIGGIVRRVITLPEIAAEALGSFLASDMKDRFGASHARLAELIPFAARLALECIGNSDALYHNVEHTMLVTLAGHDIFKGRALLRPSTPTDYANFIVACLAHDIGYVRGVVKGDKNDGYVIDGTDIFSNPRNLCRSAIAALVRSPCRYCPFLSELHALKIDLFLRQQGISVDQSDTSMYIRRPILQLLRSSAQFRWGRS
jgi:hypothetical protein